MSKSSKINIENLVRRGKSLVPKKGEVSSTFSTRSSTVEEDNATTYVTLASNANTEPSTSTIMVASDGETNPTDCTSTVSDDAISYLNNLAAKSKCRTSVKV